MIALGPLPAEADLAAVRTLGSNCCRTADVDGSPTYSGVVTASVRILAARFCIDIRLTNCCGGAGWREDFLFGAFSVLLKENAVSRLL